MKSPIQVADAPGAIGPYSQAQVVRLHGSRIVYTAGQVGLDPQKSEIVPGGVAAETRGVVERAIEGLPPAQRAVISLRDVEGWSSDEVCEALGVSEGNQRVLLHRARSKVRAALEAEMEGKP